jgi:hypothetical protein
MSTLISTDPAGDLPKVDCYDVVRVPGGRIGSVVGFYRRDAESVLVRFADHDCTEFLTSDVERCRRIAADARCWIGWD